MSEIVSLVEAYLTAERDLVGGGCCRPHCASTRRPHRHRGPRRVPRAAQRASQAGVGNRPTASADAGAAMTARIRHPKAVGTKSERDKLMFRIRVRIDPERLRARADAVRSGLPGVAYLRLDPAVAWPPQLQGDVGQ
jgi:hypothetical protein